MIDVKQLRLGNLVQYANDTYTDREDKIGNGIFRVCLISENVIKVDIGYGARQRFEKNPIVSPEMSELAPIEITEEWLIRFGFHKWGRDDMPRTLSYELGALHIFPANSFCDFEGYGFMHYQIPHAKSSKNESAKFKIKYIHQLQNLFYLFCGTELEIKSQETSTI